MCDVTRPFDGAAEADEFAPLIDALVVLRQQHELMACSFRFPEVGGQDPHLGAAEVARFLDVKPRTVAQWGFRRRLPEPDLVLCATSLWKRSTILRWAGDTGRLSSPALRGEYEERWKVEPVPHRRGGRIPEPPNQSYPVPSSAAATAWATRAGALATAPGEQLLGDDDDV